MILAELLFAALLAPWSDVATWDLLPATELPPDVLALVDPYDPLACSQLVDAAFRDVPAGFVTDTCIMESSCYASIHVGIHPLDVPAGRIAVGRALRSGRLDPDCQYVRAARGVDDTWYGEFSVRGAHGLTAAYQLKRLGGCLPPEALDVPLLSALATGRKARWHCERLRARGKKCTRLRLRCAWAMAPLGTRSCGRVIRRWKKRLKKYKSIRTNVDWDNPPTLADFRSMTHADSEDD